jgi:hypothetical protein
MEYYRVEFSEALHTIHTQFTERFQQGGLLTLQKLENTLLSGNIDPVVHDYPVMNAQLLESSYLCSNIITYTVPVERLQTFSKSCQQRCKAYLLKFKL